MQSTCQRKSETNKEDYYLRQFLTTCLSQYSYYIESDKEAIIIDPLRESDIYDEIIKERGAKLKYILETHFHADFVSGHVELAHKYGAEIVYGPTAQTEYDSKIAQDGEILPIGKVNVKVIHTPGHTLESSCYMLIDSKGHEECIFTGDTIFLGDVGRPDLAVKGDITESDLACMLYESVHKILKYNDDLVIYPGHGAGSACGKNISGGDSCTLGNQRNKNYAFNPNLSKQEFIEILTSNIPTPPQYFFHDVMMNKKGYEYIDLILEKTYKAVSLDEFKKCLADPSIVVIDSRDLDVANKGFIPGSILINLKMTYAIWVAQLYSPDTKFVLVTQPGKERESIIRLLRVGYDNILGYLDGGFEAWSKSGEEVWSYEFIDLLNQDIDKLTIIDIREKKEWNQTGTIPNSHLISLSTLENRLDDIPKTNDIVILCNSSARGGTTISLLKKKGFKNNFVNAKGGVSYLLANKFDKLKIA